MRMSAVQTALLAVWSHSSALATGHTADLKIFRGVIYTLHI